MKILVGINERGRVFGQHHGRAKLLDHEVELLRAMRDSDPDVWTPRKLAEKFEIHVRTVHKLLSYQRRGDVAVRYRAVEQRTPAG